MAERKMKKRRVKEQNVKKRRPKVKTRTKAKANVELGRNFSRQTIVVKRRSEGRQTTKTKSEKTKEEIYAIIDKKSGLARLRAR